jgi:1-acyl-sn-glycerol-3-phosphate acyltransferase
MLAEGLKTVWYWLARWGCRVFCFLVFRLRAYGRENVPAEGPFLLVSNHQSFLDPLFCGVYLKRHLHYLARDTLFRNWLFRQLIVSLNAIPVQRGKGDLSAVRTVIDRLRQGKAVCVYPEGTRTTDGRIAPFKGGLGLLARRSESPIIPVVIDGAFECWPRDRKIFAPGRVVVCYGQAITAEQAKKMKDRELAELLGDRLRRMQKHCRVKQGKEPYDY